MTHVVHVGKAISFSIRYTPADTHKTKHWKPENRRQRVSLKIWALELFCYAVDGVKTDKDTSLKAQAKQICLRKLKSEDRGFAATVMYHKLLHSSTEMCVQMVQMIKLGRAKSLT